MVGIGYFDQRGNACLKFHLCGVNHADPGIEFSGIIDTGFTGFVQLPIQHAFSLGLPLNGTASATLADGSQTSCLTALGKTTFGGQALMGVIILEFQSQDILIGMDFLRQFKSSLVVAKGHVVLLEDDWLEKAFAAYKAPAATAEPPAPESTAPSASEVPALPISAAAPDEEPPPSKPAPAPRPSN